MNLGNYPTYRRTWAQRHPVLAETLAVVGMALAICVVSYAVLYAVT